MKRKYDISRIWDTKIRDETYMLLFEPYRKVNVGEILQIKNGNEEKGEYIITNVYSARLVDIVKDRVIYKWYYADLVEYALEHDPEILEHNKLDTSMPHADWRRRLKEVLAKCILNYYDEPIDRIMQVVTFKTPARYYGGGGVFSTPTEQNWQRVKKFLYK